MNIFWDGGDRKAEIKLLPSSETDSTSLGNAFRFCGMQNRDLIT